nr:zinc finger and SCAN domain-containing protein 21-like isoform X3 [Aedes albopictus]
MSKIECDILEKPLDSKNMIEYILPEYTPARRQTLLKYFRINPGFLANPVNYPRTLNLIANDLAEPNFQPSFPEILEAIERWKAWVALQQTEPTRPPDRELKRLLEALESRLTHSQITLMLQHMEVVGGDADGLWATIAVEMRALKHPPRPEIYWRRGFEEWCQEARDRFREDPDALTALQQRYIDYARERGELDEEVAWIEVDALELVLNHCRTCLGMLRAADPKAYLFEPGGMGTTLADKINVCFGTGIDLEERLPKYVCRKCVEKVEEAYALKMQIDRTDEELKSLIGEYQKRETARSNVKNEHRETDTTETTVQTLQDASPLEVIQEEEQQLSEQLEVPEEEVEHLEGVVDAEHDVKYSWQVINDSEKMIVEQVEEHEEEHVDVSEAVQEEVEAYDDVMVATEADYLEDDIEEQYVEEETEQKTYSPHQKLSPDVKVKRQIVPDLSHNFYQCPECRIVLRSHELWETHKARHASEKRYTCEVCSKQFRSSSTLRIHQRTHTNERPYVCEVCSKAFRTHSQIKAHGFVHDRDNRPMKCERCPYRTSTKSSLSIHMKSHVTTRPYVCPHCKMGFRTSSNMHKHVRNTHEGQRPFKCPECSKTFSTKETVQKHMVTHTGSKPYACPECTSTYSWYNGLQKHMKVVHPGAPIPTEKTMMVASLAAGSMGIGEEVYN